VAAFACAVEDALRRLPGLELRFRVHGARDLEQRLAPPRALRIQKPGGAVEAPRRESRERGCLVRVEPRRANVDLLADRPLGQSSEGVELAARADSLRQRSEIVGHAHDYCDQRWLLL